MSDNFERPEPIAIVGMGCVFPGAADLDAYWSNIEKGVDAIGDVPPGRLDPVFFGDDGGPDRFYTRRGGFIDAQATFDPLAFGVMPRAAEGADPDQLLALSVADRALRDAGLPLDGAWRQRAGVVLGRGGYITPGLARLDQRVRTSQQVIEVLRSQVPGLSEEALAQIKRTFQEQLGPYGPDTAIGLVPNLAASRIANRLDLLGPAYTVDAACASALLAVDQACGELRSGRCDVMLAGGVHLCQDVTFWSVFTQLGALSRAGQIRPFDRRADGLLIGEGVGVVVLERLADAEKNGHRVYAKLLAVGTSSDGRGATLMDPRMEGQFLALERAWKMAGVSPDSVGYVEAHGTGTTKGDETELTTLGRFFGTDAPRAALGSVKSMIGHAMPAAGAAGLIRTALAVHHGVIPPSLHCEEPHPLLEKTRFRVPSRSEAWESSGTRRAAVNAFGFGGINAHAVLEAHGSAPARKAAVVHERWLALSARTPASLTQALNEGRELNEGGPYRLVLFDPTPDRRQMALKVVARERPWYGHDDLWFSPRALLADGGQTAFLLPGLEPTFEPRVEDVSAHFGLPLASAAAFKGLESQGFQVMSVSRLLFEALRRMKVRPQAVAGHSLGEWTGMLVSEMIPMDEAKRFIASLAPDTLEVPDVLFVAAGCGQERAEEAMAGLPDIALSHDNCPHQVILCGKSASVDKAMSRFQEMQVLAQKLPFRSGFHSPLFAPYLEPHRENLKKLALQPVSTPLWSATLAKPYPERAEEIRSLALDHLVRPVHFRQMIERMYEEGFRFFVQVGWGTSLTGFVEDTLRGKPSLAVSANVKARSGMAQLRRVAAAAFVAGMDVEFPGSAAREARPLRLDVPLVRLRPVAPSTSLGVNGGLGVPLINQFSESLKKIADAQQAVLAAFQKKPDVEKRRLSIESHPYLLDHCFYRQPPGWTDVTDRYPVVPMTLLLEWMRPSSAMVLTDVRAHRWLAVAPPVEITIRPGSIEGFAGATAGGTPEPWSPPPPLEAAKASPINAQAFYADRWMFHGPRYQAVRELTRLGANGIDGELEENGTPGALLDCAGQLFGFWVMFHTELDRMAFPTWLQRVEFFGPAPSKGDRLRCAVRIVQMTDHDVRANLWLWHADGRPYCRITHWQDHRFDTNARSWNVLQWPEKHTLAAPRPQGYVLVTDSWKSLASRELMGRRFLRAHERAAWEAVPPKMQGRWLNEKIAAKDAIRDARWKRGEGTLFPLEIDLAQTQVATASMDGAAVAMVGARSIAIAKGDDAVNVAAQQALGRQLPVQKVEGNRLLIDGQWVETAWDPPYGVAWT